MKTIQTVLLSISFTIIAGCSSSQKDTSSQAGSSFNGDCSREWAMAGIQNAQAKVIGLGFSTSQNPKVSQDEARAEATKDITLQLQSSVDSRAEAIKTDKTQSFKSETVITSKMEELDGAKTIKTGSNPEQGITACVVAEFDAASAYRNLSQKVSTIAKKADDLSEKDQSDGGWRQIMKELPLLKRTVNDNLAVIRRADIFKNFARIPGPGLEQKLDEKIYELETLDREIRSHLVFVVSKDGFENTAAEVKAALLDSGARVSDDTDKNSNSEDILLKLEIKSVGEMTRSKTSLGDTMTRRIAVTISDLKSGKQLAGNKGVSVSATTQEALDGQMVATALDAVRSLAPGLLKK